MMISLHDICSVDDDSPLPAVAKQDDEEELFRSFKSVRDYWRLMDDVGNVLEVRVGR
jgi:hypothetical protein